MPPDEVRASAHPGSRSHRARPRVEPGAPSHLSPGRRKVAPREALFTNRARARGTSTALVQLEPVSGSPEILDSELARLAGSLLGRVAASGTPAFDSVLRRLAQRRSDSLLILDDVTEMRHALVLSRRRESARQVPRGGRERRASGPHQPVLLLDGERISRPPCPRDSARLERGARRSGSLRARANRLVVTGGLVVHAVALADALEDGASSVDRALQRELSPGRTHRGGMPRHSFGAPPPGARLRRLQDGAPRLERRAGSEAERGRAARRPHAGLDPRLPAMARRSRSHRVPRQALLLRRPAAAALDAYPRSRNARDARTTSRARSALISKDSKRPIRSEEPVFTLPAARAPEDFID